MFYLTCKPTSAGEIFTASLLMRTSHLRWPVRLCLASLSLGENSSALRAKNRCSLVKTTLSVNGRTSSEIKSIIDAASKIWGQNYRCPPSVLIHVTHWNLQLIPCSFQRSAYLSKRLAVLSENGEPLNGEPVSICSFQPRTCYPQPRSFVLAIDPVTQDDIIVPEYRRC